VGVTSKISFDHGTMLVLFPAFWVAVGGKKAIALGGVEHMFAILAQPFQLAAGNQRQMERAVPLHPRRIAPDTFAGEIARFLAEAVKGKDQSLLYRPIPLTESLADRGALQDDARSHEMHEIVAADGGDAVAAPLFA